MFSNAISWLGACALHSLGWACLLDCSTGTDWHSSWGLQGLYTRSTEHVCVRSHTAPQTQGWSSHLLSRSYSNRLFRLQRLRCIFRTVIAHIVTSMRFNSFTTGCHPGRRADPHAWRMCYILRSHSDSPKDKLILMDTGRHSLTGQTQTFVTSVRPVALLTHWCWTKAAHVPKETNEVPLSSTEDETLHHQSMCIRLIRLSAPRLHRIETNMCVCQPISVQTGCHLMMKWRGKQETEGGTSAPVFLFSPVESSLPQSSSQWGSAWGGKCCFFRSVSPYPLIPSHDWQSWFRVYGVPF